MKMKERGYVTNHVNKFNSTISRLIYVDIRLEYEVQEVLLLYLLQESCSRMVTAVSSSSRTMKLTFEIT